MFDKVSMVCFILIRVISDFSHVIRSHQEKHYVVINVVLL